jgi:hypothetical protein
MPVRSKAGAAVRGERQTEGQVADQQVNGAAAGQAEPLAFAFSMRENGPAGSVSRQPSLSRGC